MEFLHEHPWIATSFGALDHEYVVVDKSDWLKAKEMEQTIREACIFLKRYSNDAGMATHAKRILSNAIFEFDKSKERQVTVDP